jgi:basic membrane protein A
MFGDYYNQMALRALVIVTHEFGLSFELVISPTQESVLQDLQNLCRLDYDALITVGNSMQAPTVTCAKEFPKQRFVLIDGNAEGIPNVISYSSDPYDISFLCGEIAVRMGHSHATGCILWSENWVAREWIGSFILGTLAAEETSKVYYSFASTAEEAYQKANLQFKNGAEIIMCHAGAADLGIINAARDNGRYALGFLNERRMDPEHVLFDVVRHMEPLFHDAVRRTLHSLRGGKLIKMRLKEGSFGLDLENSHRRVGAEQKRMIAGMISQIKRGKFDSGRARIASAKSLESIGGTRI